MGYDKEILERTGIFVFENTISDELCDETIKKFYDKDTKKHNGSTGSGYEPSMKNTIDWYIIDKYFLNKYQDIYNKTLKEVVNYYVQLSEMDFFWSGLQFQKNKKDEGFFRWHTDNSENINSPSRFLGYIFYLNDVEEGGETEFRYQNINIKPKKGTIVIFPSTWVYYHRGVAPVSNDKYIITTFAMADR